MKYCESYADLIAHTPLVRLGNMDFPGTVNVFAKMELLNPTGSSKDRMARAMIEAAEKEGKLSRDSIIVEASSGNAGISIAFVSISRGYHTIIVLPTKFSQEKHNLLRALGAEIVNTPKENGMKGAFDMVRKLLEKHKNAVCLDQFSNIANSRVHFETTGPEIYNALDGQIDYFVSGAGTGGTISGVMGYMKTKNKNIKGVLADPVGSTMGGGTENHYLIEGIGNSFMPKIMDMTLVDEVFKVSDAEAFSESKQLALKEGILAGSSSGAVLAAARKLSKQIDRGNIVVVLADRGDRYFSKNLYTQS
ncbi:MAG: cysteine synthase family protein [Rickettsiales bacterium]|jgi:cysteine synthase A|nr:cysteine synthase family protein [Rickettsiales bacterium]